MVFLQLHQLVYCDFAENPAIDPYDREKRAAAKTGYRKVVAPMPGHLTTFDAKVTPQRME